MTDLYAEFAHYVENGALTENRLRRVIDTARKRQRNDAHMCITPIT